MTTVCVYSVAGMLSTDLRHCVTVACRLLLRRFLPGFAGVMDPDLRRQALTHSSYTNEHPGSAHNERLEWLGDAVVQFVVSRPLFTEHPHASEAELSRRRAALVSNEHMATLLSPDERASLRTGKSRPDSSRLLAGAYEALVGAVFLSGIDVVDFVRHRMLRCPEPAIDDPVSLVQAHEQKRSKRPPIYTVVGVPAGFECELVTWWGVFRSRGRSKKAARKAAAQAALADLTGGSGAPCRRSG